jgi:hypothetical protein
LAVDTTQATAGNRVLLYVNGASVTDITGVTVPAQNTNLAVNSTAAHYIGQFNSSNYFDGYMTEVNFIDGQALTPTSFGSTNALTGVWQPARYTGTYGTNGFYLKFTDNSTAAALGTDFSGNSNTWTTNNISVTAGVTYDSMTDVPTLTSATAANFAVLNPILQNSWWASPNRGNISNANLRLSGQNGTAFSTFDVATTGKWYLELTITSYNNGSTYPSSIITSARSRNTFEISYLATGVKSINSTPSAYGASWTTGDIIGIAIDKANNQVTFYKNNVSQGAITNTFPSETVLVGYYAENVASDTIDFNFGQRPFTYTPPTGFVALNTFNLPTSTIVKGNTVMSATLFDTNGGSYPKSITGVGFQPDFVWIKSRSQAYPHYLWDVVRGTGIKSLSTNSTAAEGADGVTSLTSFNSDGWTIGAGNGVGETNGVSWNWKANGAGVSNTNGTITSTVSVNASAGFSVVTYTGTGVAATVGHGLGVAPSFIVVKRRDSTANWNVYHASVGATGVLLLNTTDSTTTTSVPWNNTAPTSSVFTVGTGADVNASGGTFVAYCWAAISGFSAMGSYVGNASADGPFVFTGFRPKYVLIKRSTGATDLGNWILMDTARDSYNVANNQLYPNTSNAENGIGGSGDDIDILSNGFKVRGSGGWTNQSGSTMVYICYAENPFRNSLAR